MRSLGQYLQEERRARGISLEQISASTRISMDMLRAIEEGNTQLLPAPVLVKGFLKAFATNIGLDPEEVIVKYHDLIQESDARPETLENFHQRLRPRTPPRRGLVLAVTLTLIAGLSLALWWSHYAGQKRLPPTAGEPEPVATSKAFEETPPSVAPPERHQEQSTTQIQESVAVSETGSKTEPAEPELNFRSPAGPPSSEEISALREGDVSPPKDITEQATEQAPVLPPYVLRAETLDKTWLKVVIDDSDEREYMLQPGEQVTWRATAGFVLTVGNAAGLRLYLNDKPIRPLGESGRVVRVKLPDPSLVIDSDSEQTDSAKDTRPWDVVSMRQ